MLPYSIRPQKPEDFAPLLQLTYKAFLTLDYPGRTRMDEHFLLHLLRDSKSVLSELSFVAEENGTIIGHILYTRSKIIRSDGSEIDTLSFGPLSVLPTRHKEGIGAALVAHSLEKARALGYGAVCITGVPDYYPKLGFKRAQQFGLTLEDGSVMDAFMAYELSPGYLSGGGRLLFLAPEYQQCETDDEGCEAFHRQFMAEHFPAQILLRPFWDADVARMEQWLMKPHVAKWYHHPEDWLHEVKSRRDEFFFLSHFIVEFEGIPIGFCQYYDCFDTQKHEVWDEAWLSDIQKGHTFSIDYLIGEPEHLGKGHGKKIVQLLTEKVRLLSGKRIIAQPDAENIPSLQTLKSSGFSYNSNVLFLEL